MLVVDTGAMRAAAKAMQPSADAVDRALAPIPPGGAATFGAGPLATSHGSYDTVVVTALRAAAERIRRTADSLLAAADDFDAEEEAIRARLAGLRPPR